METQTNLNYFNKKVFFIGLFLIILHFVFYTLIATGGGSFNGIFLILINPLLLLSYLLPPLTISGILPLIFIELFACAICLYGVYLAAKFWQKLYIRIVFYFVVLIPFITYTLMISRPFPVGSLPLFSHPAEPQKVSSTSTLPSISYKQLSSEEIEFTFSVPSNTENGQFYMKCDAGLSAYFSDNITPRTPEPYPNICNTWQANIWGLVQPNSTSLIDIRDIRIENGGNYNKSIALQITANLNNNTTVQSGSVKIIVGK